MVQIDNGSTATTRPPSPSRSDKSYSSSSSTSRNDNVKCKQLVTAVMQQYGIDPKSVLSRHVKLSQPLNGIFTCLHCEGKHWSSAWCWIVVDLRRQIVAYRYKQKCRDCLEEAVPYLHADHMRKAIEIVCERYQKRIFDDDQDPGRKRGNVPFVPKRVAPNYPTVKNHPMKLCEKCDYGARIEPCYQTWFKMCRRHNWDYRNSK